MGNQNKPALCPLLLLLMLSLLLKLLKLPLSLLLLPLLPPPHATVGLDQRFLVCMLVIQLG